MGQPQEQPGQQGNHPGQGQQSSQPRQCQQSPGLRQPDGKQKQFDVAQSGSRGSGERQDEQEGAWRSNDHPPSGPQSMTDVEKGSA